MIFFKRALSIVSAKIVVATKVGKFALIATGFLSLFEAQIEYKEESVVDGIQIAAELKRNESKKHRAKASKKGSK